MAIPDSLNRVVHRNARSPLRVAGILGMLLVAVLLISACSKVPLPEEDDSATRVEWQVIDALGGGLALTASGPDDVSSAHVGEMVVVQLQAEDGQGVRRVKLSEPVMTYTCVDAGGNAVAPDGAQEKLILDSQEQTLVPDAAGEVFSEVWLFDTVYFNHDCGDGMTLAEVTATFYGEAENYFDAVSTGTLILTHTP